MRRDTAEQDMWKTQPVAAENSSLNK